MFCPFLPEVRIKLKPAPLAFQAGKNEDVSGRDEQDSAVQCSAV
jgi:hypothetical protein